MARADYGSWYKFNGKIVTEKEQLEIINKVKKADNINYYADAILSLCDGKYILSYFKGYYFTFHVFNGESYDYISEDSIIKVHTADMNDYKYHNKGVKNPFIYKNEDIILKIFLSSTIFVSPSEHNNTYSFPKSSTSKLSISTFASAPTALVILLLFSLYSSLSLVISPFDTSISTRE